MNKPPVRTPLLKLPPIIVGIDPGLSGGIAIFCDDDWELEESPVIVVKTKQKTIKGNYKNKKHADVVGYSSILGKAKVEGRETHVFIESVHAMPKQGVSSSFNFGMVYGMWLGVIAAYQFPVHKVTPQAWKKFYKIRGGAEKKDESRLKAINLFPHLHGELKLKKYENKAEALLIAHYGKTQVLGV